MAKKTSKLLFVYDMPLWKEPLWADGLWAALNVLEKDYKITRHNLRREGSSIPHDYDFILGWGAFGSPVDTELQNAIDNRPEGNKTRFGLCIAGNAYPPTGATKYDVLFYETKWYRDQINFHPNIVQAFGVNTDIFFQSDLPVPIVWDYIGVGSFSSWKRWEKMKDKQGNRLVIGEYQRENEQESLGIVADLVRNGVMVSDMINPFDLANFYNWTRTLYIPADVYGGGERAILEARACGLDVEIEEDNPKLKELLSCDIPDHNEYAKKLKKGMAL